MITRMLCTGRGGILAIKMLCTRCELLGGSYRAGLVW